MIIRPFDIERLIRAFLLITYILHLNLIISGLFSGKSRAIAELFLALKEFAARYGIKILIDIRKFLFIYIAI